MCALTFIYLLHLFTQNRLQLTVRCIQVFVSQLEFLLGFCQGDILQHVAKPQTPHSQSLCATQIAQIVLCHFFV